MRPKGVCSRSSCSGQVIGPLGLGLRDAFQNRPPVLRTMSLTENACLHMGDKQGVYQLPRYLYAAYASFEPCAHQLCSRLFGFCISANFPMLSFLCFVKSGISGRSSLSRHNEQ